MGIDLGAIRKLINDALNKDDFENILFDHFRDVRAKFTDGQSQDARLRELLDYVDRQQEIPKLLKAIEECNPIVYEEFVKRQIKILENEIDILIKKQSESSDGHKRAQIIQETQVKISKLEALKRSLDKSQKTILQKCNIRKIDLAKINFEAARKQIDPQCEILRNKGGFISLIVENCHNYKGDLLIDEIRDRFKNGKPNFKSILIDPKSGGWSDEQGLLASISNGLNILGEDIPLTSEYLIDKIIEQCCPAKTFFFELLNWGELQDRQSDLLIWFYNFFWNSLIQKQGQIETKAKKVRFISIVNSRGRLDKECFSLTCSEVLKVESCIWKEEEIDSWLTEYGQFRSNDEITAKARRIFDLSEGLPLSVYAALQEDFCFI
ncbi:hypothetical protein V2H45_11040 [Tumidithrix elongata RA019]|uniref:Effector-associated domain-containing protein n=1 Tax=Tumidithrix elongata BACA0141 TaxID=2716417 RepID=A0AAW9Q0B3_9CYAN|nr:hypothetical protein [Tumidithrix elongata RA019]